MLPINLTAFLQSHRARYLALTHAPAFTASSVAQTTHVPGRHFAKTVVLLIDGRPAMLVVPAAQRIPFSELRELLDASEVRLATEQQLREWFPDCEVGAMPPFGALYHMPVYVTSNLLHQDFVAFNAGTHTDVVKMPREEFVRLAEPREIELAPA